MKLILLAIASICAALSVQAGEPVPIIGNTVSFDDRRVSLRIFEFLPEASSSNTLVQVANHSSRSIRLSGKFGAPVLEPGSMGTISCGSGFVSMTFHFIDSQTGAALAHLVPTCGSQVVVVENPTLIDLEQSKRSGEQK